MGEDEGVTVLSLNLRNRWSCQLQDPTTLPPDKQLLCPLSGRNIGTQISSGHFEEEKIILLLSGIEPRLFHRPSLSLVPIPTALSRVLHATTTLHSVILSTVKRWQYSTRNKRTILCYRNSFIAR